MKKLEKHEFDAVHCRVEWNDFDALLKTKLILSERQDILPFFKKRHDLSMLIGSYISKWKTR